MYRNAYLLLQSTCNDNNPVVKFINQRPILRPTGVISNKKGAKRSFFYDFLILFSFNIYGIRLNLMP